MRLHPRRLIHRYRQRDLLRAAVELLEPRRLLAGAAGDLDLGYGFMGNAITPHVGDVDDSGDAIALLPDGKILVGGNIWAGVNFPTLTRYNSNGTLDTTFGAGGTVKATSLAWRSMLDMAVSNLDGSILAISSSTSSTSPLIQRFTSSGALDPAWVGPGTGTISGRPAGLALLSDGRSYFATSSTLARLKTDGTLDTTFGGGTGKITFPTPTSPDFLRYDPYAIAAQSDGSVYVAGERLSISTGAKRAFVRKYTASGTLDTTFAASGTLLLATSTTDSAVRGMRIQPSSLVVVTGGNGADTFVARFNGSGTMDPTFGVSGVRTFAASATASDDARRIAFGTSGQIYLGGYVSDVGPFIARVTSAGALDAAYDGNGILEQPLPAGWPVFGGANIAHNAATNQIVMTTCASDTFNQTWDEVLTRYTSSGALDTTFAAGGISRIDRTHAQSVARNYNGSVMQPDGKLVHFGSSQWVEGDVTLRRLNLDGSPDTTFGTGGLAEVDLGSRYESPLAATVQSDGKIVVVGRADRLVGPITAPTWEYKFFVARFNANGTRDTTFDGDGVNLFQYPDGYWGAFTSVAVLGDGNIVAAGNFQDTTGARTGIVAKFAGTNGALDMTFGGAGNGRKLIDLPGTGEVVEAIMPYASGFGAPGSNGLILAGSVDTTATNTDRFVARLGYTGEYVTTFGGSGTGYRIFDASPDDYERAFALAGFDPTAGWIHVASTDGTNLLLTRLGGNGAPDTSFGTGGTATVPLPAGTSALSDMRRATGGQFYFAGTRTRPGTSDDDALLMRLTSAGALDSAFGTGGVANVDFGSADDDGFDVHLAADDRVIVGGRRVIADVGEWAAARVIGAATTTPLQVLDRRVLPFTPGPRFELTFGGDLISSADDADLIMFNPATGARYDDFTLGLGVPSQTMTMIAWSRSEPVPNGLYKVVIPAGALSDSAGNPQGEYSFDFFVHNGSSNADFYSVRRLDASNVRVSYGPAGAPATLFDVPAPAVDFGTAIYLGGGTAGDDVFTVDYTPGELPAVSITPDGRSGSDTLNYIGRDGATFELTPASVIARIGTGAPAASTLFGPGVENLGLDAATYNFNGATFNKHVNIKSEAFANINVTQRLGTLTISGQANVPAGGDKVILTTGLSITGTGYLDLTDNDLAINYPASGTSPLGTFTPGSGYSGVTEMLARAYNFNAWDQPGLRSSAPLAVIGEATLAPAEARDVLFLEPGQTALWNGVTVDSTTVLVKYTYAGDVNLDGLVDAADYGVIDNWIQFPGTDGYANGDFNFDGIIDAADYGIIDNSIQMQGSPL